MRLFAEYPRLGISDYRELLSYVPPPTAKQIEAFADYVSRAKSWYKHLPLWPPGEPFAFYIDPTAGMDRVLTDGGDVIYMERTLQTPEFHYTWMPTDEYRSKYGFLAFACPVGTQLMTGYQEYLPDDTLISGTLDNNPCRASVNGKDGREYDIPKEVEDTGSIDVTGLIHPRLTSDYVYRSYTRKGAQMFRGQDTGAEARIFQLCQRITEDEKRDCTPGADEHQEKLEALDKLIDQERECIRERMVKTIQSVVDLVYPNTAG